jgi:hypothetical protein
LTVQPQKDGTIRPRHAIDAGLINKKKLTELVNAQEFIILMMGKNAYLVQMICQYGMGISVLHAQLQLITMFHQKRALSAQKD